ncbi:ornithine cyclodeaminase family protein [Vogesella sp. LIG4]|uniref:ornithine cyclodeaminase family protein n=1 Tax=Vogesella sp. LIG4 TaxID=1192162 RepID=UPI00081F7E02|nr:ornithine cyclodeaminase family protein [Vogesella sp. LIG4]SCK30190.1 ornithine cyclodeaminase [Vogesella sp. LIG4]
MKVLGKAEILQAFRPALALRLLREGFIAYSAGQVQLPPVQHFGFDAGQGDCCIKSGYLDGDDLFAVKVSAGFYHNQQHGLANNQGLIMTFSARTGAPQALLLDEGVLTGLRTALTGRLVAEVMAPLRVDAIGVLGTGLQARLQLEALHEALPCRRVWVWGKSETELARFIKPFAEQGYDMRPTLDAREVARHCQYIVCCTPSTSPLLQAEWIAPGTHITALGADAVGKQELATELVVRADVLVADSVEQCTGFGELQHAFAAGLIDVGRVRELGTVLAGRQPGRGRPDDITIADLTGLAIQDVQIAKSVLLALG